jgi:16S rRNA (adenine1518-N6/adenine1519-N6)-dimethyltransferase
LSLNLKKSLGQHFLIDQNVLHQIGQAIFDLRPISNLIEIGPGMGALTEQIIDVECKSYSVIEKDDRFVTELSEKFPKLKGHIFHQDVLAFDWEKWGQKDNTVVGNYPYNISNLIMFWIIENPDYVINSVGMFQKEVAKRISAIHGSKDYGILSILTQSLYEVNYLFDIPATAFDPPPKVVSGVIKMHRLETPKADFRKLKYLVKMAFNLRRKMLSNSLKSMQWTDETMFLSVKNLRPEQLSIDDFCELSKFVKF